MGRVSPLVWGGLTGFNVVYCGFIVVLSSFIPGWAGFHLRFGDGRRWFNRVYFVYFGFIFA